TGTQHGRDARHMSKSFLSVNVLLAACASRTTTSTVAAGTPLTALRFGFLADGGGTLKRDAVIVVQGDRIISVGTGAGAIPRGATVVDLTGYTAIPGLIDVHTHMTYWRDKARPNGAGAPRSKDSVVMFSAENARKTLE